MKLVFLISLVLLSLSGRTQDITVSMRPKMLEAFEYAMLEITKQNALHEFPVDSSLHATDGGAFPVHEHGKYKCIYWQSFPVLKVVKRVSFNEKLAMSSMVLDTTNREFSPGEAAAFRLYHKVLRDVYKSSHFEIIPNSFASIVPMITNETRKAYINLRSFDISTCLFGYDWEYIFDKDDRLISKVKGHSKESRQKLANAKPGRMMHESWTHDISDDKGREVSVPDLATVYFFYSIFSWKYFVFKNIRDVIVFDVDKSYLFRLTNDEYKQMTESPKYKLESQ